MNIDVRKIIEPEESSQKPLRDSIFLKNNYTEYESNGDKNETLSIKEYHDEIKQYLKDIMNNSQKSDIWKI